MERVAEVRSICRLCLGRDCRAVCLRRHTLSPCLSMSGQCEAMCVQVDITDMSTTADGIPTAVLRLRPRQLPSFLMTLRVAAAGPADLDPALCAVVASANVSLPSTPTAASLPPPLPAGSRLSELCLSPATGDMLSPQTRCGTPFLVTDN